MNIRSDKNNKRGGRRNNMIPKNKVCFFCVEKISQIEYKDADLLRRFMTGQGKIASPKRTGICSRHQRILAAAIKKARFMAIVPYTSR